MLSQTLVNNQACSRQLPSLSLREISALTNGGQDQNLETKKKQQERKHKKPKEKPRPGGDFESKIFCFAKEAEFSG